VVDERPVRPLGIYLNNVEAILGVTTVLVDLVLKVIDMSRGAAESFEFAETLRPSL
jgi:hypothetical protein